MISLRGGGATALVTKGGVYATMKGGILVDAKTAAGGGSDVTAAIVLLAAIEVVAIAVVIVVSRLGGG